MADTDTETAPAPAAPAAAPPPGVSIDDLLQLAAKLRQPQQIQNPQGQGGPPATSGVDSYFQAFGKGLTRGDPYPATPEEQEDTGRAALMGFGLGMMPGAGERTSAGDALRGGLLGAASAAQTERAQQIQMLDIQGKQQEQQFNALKVASSLLNTQLEQQRLRASMGLPNPLAGGSAAAAPVTGAPITGAAPTSIGAVTGKDDFVQKFTPVAEAISAQTGLPANYVLSQAGLETGWGSSSAAKNNNFFGIIDPKTGKPASYATPQDGINAYITLMSSDRYKDVPRTGSPAEIGDRMALAGYNPNVPKKDSTDSYGARIGNFAAALAPPQAAAGAAAAPAPYRVAGPAVAPPSAPTAPPQAGAAGAALPTPPIPPAGAPPSVTDRPTALALAGAIGQQVPIPGMQGMVAKPNGNIGPPSAPPAAAAPEASPTPTTLPPTAPPAAQPGSQQPTDTRPDSALTFEEYKARHAFQPTPEERSTFTIAPDPTSLQDAQKAQQTAAQQLQLARSGMPGVDGNKALSDFNIATDAVNKLKQDAAVQSAKNQQDWYKNQTATLAENYRTAQTIAAQQALEAQKGQQAIDLEHIKAGTLETAAQRKADIDIAQNDLTERSADAQKAAHIIPVLQQIGSQLGNLPGGVVGTLLAKYDTTGDLTGMLSKMGVVDPSKATAAQLLIAARNFLSIETKPAATGSLRVPEMDKLQAYTPGMLNTPQAQQEMISRLIAYQQRIQDERDFAGNYFGRTDPKTGQRIYDNRGLDKAMNAPVQYNENGIVTGGGLGPVVPEPPPVSAPDAEHQAYLNYIRRNIKPGMPYQTWAAKTNTDGSIVNDANGKPVPQRVTKVQGYD